jgi:hypothetical protein
MGTLVRLSLLMKGRRTMEEKTIPCDGYTIHLWGIEDGRTAVVVVREHRRFSHGWVLEQPLGIVHRRLLEHEERRAQLRRVA